MASHSSPELDAAIQATVEKAARNRDLLDCRRAARKLLRRHPDCGLSIGELEQQIIRVLGQVKGSSAMIGRTDRQSSNPC